MKMYLNDIKFYQMYDRNKKLIFIKSRLFSFEFFREASCSNVHAIYGLMEVFCLFEIETLIDLSFALHDIVFDA